MPSKDKTHLKASKELILMIEARPEIWNGQNKDHNAQEIKYEIFAQIWEDLKQKNIVFNSGKVSLTDKKASKLNFKKFAKEDVRKRWRSLRDNYTRLFKQLSNNGSQNIDDQQKKGVKGKSLFAGILYFFKSWHSSKNQEKIRNKAGTHNGLRCSRSIQLTCTALNGLNGYGWNFISVNMCEYTQYNS